MAKWYIERAVFQTPLRFLSLSVTTHTKMTQKQRKILYPTVFFVGLILIIFEIHIFRNTIINLSIPIGIIFFVGIISIILDFKNYKKTYKKVYKKNRIVLYIYSVMQNIISYGFITCSIFMLVNFYLADKKQVKKTFEIVERTSLPGPEYHREERNPTFSIVYNGKIKELVFEQMYYNNMNSYNYIELEIKKGFFGFDILENKRLK